MPRDDIHTAADIIRVMQEEVRGPTIVATPEHLPNPLTRTTLDARATTALIVARQAIEHQLAPGEVAKFKLTEDATHFTRLSAAIERAQQTARFRR
jgi:hypothetical protein